MFSQKVYNEFSAGNIGKGGGYDVRVGAEFPAFNLPWMLEFHARNFQYSHNSTITAAQFAASPDGNPCPHVGPTGPTGTAAGDPGCVTVIGGYGQVPVGSFNARDSDAEFRLGFRIFNPRVYIGAGYDRRVTNYGYPLEYGWGYGIEKLPDLDQRISVYGSYWAYPSQTGNFTFPANAPNGLANTSSSLQEGYRKFQIGGTYSFGDPTSSFAPFFDIGFLGDNINNKTNAPSNGTHSGFYAGLGLKF